MSLLVGNLGEQEQAREATDILLSQACEQLIKLPVPGGTIPFRLDKRLPFLAPYDAFFHNVVLATGRQVGKSTFLGNRMVIRSSLIPYLISLYVSPTHMQTARFSRDRLQQIVHVSRDLALLKGTNANDAILSKKFQNGAEIILRYAFLSADRIRGIFAHELYLDEYQDLVPSIIPVIEQCLHNAPPETRSQHYVGTFKSVENGLTDLYYNQSNPLEWIVPCSKHPFTYWNILGPNNIGKHGPICERCGTPVDPNNPKARWASTDVNPQKPKFFTGFRLPQIALPCDWEKVKWDMRRFPTDQFYNDCLALPYDSGTRALTVKQLKDVCEMDVFMSWSGGKGAKDLNYWKKKCAQHRGYAGVDWGGGTGTGYTVLSIGTYGGTSRFHSFYHKRYEGVESDPLFAVQDILQKCRDFNVEFIGLDFGYGFGTNDSVIRQFGRDRAYMFQYVTSKYKAIWDTSVGRFKINRTEILADFFNGIKRGDTVRFPRYEDFTDPFGKNFLAVFLEETQNRTRLQYSHAVSDPDDAVHSTLYSYLVACIAHPRPHFFAPISVTERDLVTTTSGKPESFTY